MLVPEEVGYKFGVINENDNQMAARIEICISIYNPQSITHLFVQRHREQTSLG
jgi:hypothetical protein